MSVLTAAIGQSTLDLWVQPLCALFCNTHVRVLKAAIGRPIFDFLCVLTAATSLPKVVEGSKLSFSFLLCTTHVCAHGSKWSIACPQQQFVGLTLTSLTLGLGLVSPWFSPRLTLVSPPWLSLRLAAATSPLCHVAATATSPPPPTSLPPPCRRRRHVAAAATVASAATPPPPRRRRRRHVAAAATSPPPPRRRRRHVAATLPSPHVSSTPSPP